MNNWDYTWHGFDTWKILCLERKRLCILAQSVLTSGKLYRVLFGNLVGQRWPPILSRSIRSMIVTRNCWALGAHCWLSSGASENILLVVGFLHVEQMFDWTIFLSFFPFCPQGPLGFSLEARISFFFCFVLSLFCSWRLCRFSSRLGFTWFLHYNCRIMTSWIRLNKQLCNSWPTLLIWMRPGFRKALRLESEISCFVIDL